MRRPDFWNWPPFMTVRRHNRIVTDIIEQAQAAIDQEHARATREGRAQVHRWAVEANANLFYGTANNSAYSGHGLPTVAAARGRAALQQAEHMFAPDKTDLKEAIDAAARTS